MKRAIKFQILVLVALLALVVALPAAVTATSGANPAATAEPQTQVTEPVVPAGVQPEPTTEAPVEVQSPATEPATVATEPVAPATEPATTKDKPAETPKQPASKPDSKSATRSVSDSSSSSKPATKQSVPAQQATPAPQADQPKAAEGPAWGVVEGLVRDGGGNLVDGVTFKLYRLEEGGGQTLLGTTVSGPGAYGPWASSSHIIMAPYPAGWVGWKDLPTTNGDLYHVDYALEMVPPAGYYATSATTQSGRIWSPTDPNEFHPFCWWRQFEYTVDQQPVIDGYKYKDLNENGKMDEGEPGIPKVTIKLDGEGGSAVTDQNGYFKFLVLPGTHTVAVDESTAPGYYPTSPTSIDIDVPKGSTKTVYFGNAPFGSISGHKWLDPDKDGQLDGDETPVKGVTIKLTGKTNVGGETVNMETTTTDDGSYSFTGLKAGTYTISEVVPDDMQAVSPTSVDVTLKPGDTLTDIDFFNASKKGRITGYKFKDMNENGQMDQGEVGIPGIVITLDGDKAQTVTDESGFFSFDVDPGVHVVAVDESSVQGYYPTTVTSLEVEVSAGGQKTVYFGNAPFGSIAGHKWEDPDRNGVHESGEPPVAGVTIDLTGKTNVGGETVNMETTTGTDGSYSFTGLKAGKYTVSEVVPVNMEAVTPDSVDVTLGVGQDVTGVDFLNATTATPTPPTPPTTPTQPTIASTSTPTTSTVSGTTLPFTGMNKAPISISSWLAIGLGLLLLIAGFAWWRRQQVELAREDSAMPGRKWR